MIVFIVNRSLIFSFLKKINGGIEGIIINGIDRINNDIGYTIENSLTCCKICNYAKNTMSMREFIAWLEKIVSNLEILKLESKIVNKLSMS